MAQLGRSPRSVSPSSSRPRWTLPILLFTGLILFLGFAATVSGSSSLASSVSSAISQSASSSPDSDPMTSLQRFISNMKIPPNTSLPAMVGILLTNLKAWLWAQVSTSADLWRTLAIILAASCVKNFPLVWHARVFGAMFYHMYCPKNLPPPRSLFSPLITSSFTPVTEIDWNIHKSNSTYYSDLDVARTHLVTSVLRRGFTRTSRYYKHLKSRNAARRQEGLPPLPVAAVPCRVAEPPTMEEIAFALAREGAASAAGCPFASNVAASTLGDRKMTYRMMEVDGRHTFALGGTATFFNREIAPFQSVEFWTRVVAWDRKWIYIVTHVVEKGHWSREVGKKGGWLLQPWKNHPGSKPTVRRNIPEASQKAHTSHHEKIDSEDDGEESEFQKKVQDMAKQALQFRLRRSIYATSVSRYVLKKGKVTVPPELVIRRSDMLPDKPEWAPMSTEVPDADQVRDVVRRHLERKKQQQQQRRQQQQQNRPHRGDTVLVGSADSTGDASAFTASSAASTMSGSDSLASSSVLPSTSTSPASSSALSSCDPDSLDPLVAADIYIQWTKHRWEDQSDSDRQAELDRRAKMEPSSDIDDPAYFEPVPEAEKAAATTDDNDRDGGDSGRYLDWEEVERKRIAGLLTIGDSVAKLDSGLTDQFRGSDEPEGVLGIYWDL